MSSVNKKNVTESGKTAVRKPIRCVVTSDKMNKSRVAVSEYLVKHPLVGKYLKRSTKYMFHDEGNETKVGDQVLIKPCRPMSGMKKFNLVSIVKRAVGYDELTDI